MTLEKQKQRLMSRNRLPPGGAWFYTVPETKAKFEDRMSFSALIRKVSDHYLANKLPIPDGLDILIEQHICENTSSGVCVGGDGQARRLDFFSVLSATEMLIRRRLTTSKDFFVTQEEALARANTCLSCPLNLKYMCTTCNGLRDTFKRLVVNRNTPYDSKLGVCEACGCGLSAKIHIKKKYLPPMPSDTASKVPEYCWALGE